MKQYKNNNIANFVLSWKLEWLFCTHIGPLSLYSKLHFSRRVGVGKM